MSDIGSTLYTPPRRLGVRGAQSSKYLPGGYYFGGEAGGIDAVVAGIVQHARSYTEADSEKAALWVRRRVAPEVLAVLTTTEARSLWTFRRDGRFAEYLDSELVRAVQWVEIERAGYVCGRGDHCGELRVAAADHELGDAIASSCCPLGLPLCKAQRSRPVGLTDLTHPHTDSGKGWSCTWLI